MSGLAAMSAGKKAALTALGMCTGVGGAVAYKLDQVSTLLFLTILLYDYNCPSLRYFETN